VGEEALYLVGTGNWGYWNRRQRYGDIGKAWRDVPENAFTILLTHDPTHWEYQVFGKYPAALTLSGHTHGLQMGIPVNGRYWSPASWLYRYWAGLYEGPLGQADGHTFPTYLYVNRGLGYIGLPARFGVWPEITSSAYDAGRYRAFLLRLVPMLRAYCCIFGAWVSVGGYMRSSGQCW
jgi:predicted MPP superfamily phosphohydrolase